MIHGAWSWEVAVTIVTDEWGLSGDLVGIGKVTLAAVLREGLG